MSDFLVVTGLSGAGRSAAGDVLEDMGWFILDNLPPSLLGSIADLVDAPGFFVERLPVLPPSMFVEFFSMVGGYDDQCVVEDSEILL